MRWPCAALAVVSVAGLAGCSAPAQLRYEAALEAAPPGASHGIHDERLRQLMRELDRLRNERLPQALDKAEEEERDAASIARVAGAMADSAPRIASSAPPRLSAPERVELRQLADALESQARTLAARARTLTPDERAARLEEIDLTCRTCHSRFRIPGIGQ